ncbi:MAG TPA: zinc ABC transporter substrate-binding protein [Actinomycetes bacterium]|nr:zinc ABC transporter substrate-binding protein [Actinomycetes bacterium]
MRTRIRVLAGLSAALVVSVTGCSTGSSPSGATSSATGSAAATSRVIQVVAAENFWGSIAAQLGGKHVKVTNIIDNPDADPHDYEPTAADGRAIAGADFVLINGIGYDTWATKLADANPNSSRTELTVGELLGVAAGGNPHRWYNPDDVQKVVDAIATDYEKLDPADAAYFEAQQAAFEDTATADYKSVIADIKAKYSGTPVGASESIFAMIAPALGLNLLTPPDFLKAISEGTDPTAADKATIDEQIKDKKIKVYVYNSQNATPDIQRQVDEAKAAGIPVSTITETMTPATDTWEQWQTTQLRKLRDALAQAAGS